MKTSILTVSLLAALLLTGCQTTSPGPDEALSSLPPVHPVRSEQHLLEVLHYASLWHYDRSFLTTDPDGETLDIWYRQVFRDLDPGDESVFAELWIPLVDMLIDLEKSDYHINELGLHVVDDSFKVRRVVRTDEPPVSVENYKRHTITFERLREWYADNIRVAKPLSPSLRERLQEVVFAHPFRDELSATENTIFHVAPISPACDDLWVFHENNKQLLLFSSDMDLGNEAYWKVMPVSLKVYDLDAELILAPDEGAQGTARLSKDFVGRALFNCVVLGRRVEGTPEEVQKALAEYARRRAE